MGSLNAQRSKTNFNILKFGIASYTAAKSDLKFLVLWMYCHIAHNIRYNSAWL